MRYHQLFETSPLAGLVKQDQDERNAYQRFVQTNANGDWEKGAAMYAKLKGRPADDIFGDHARFSKFINMTFDFSSFTKDDWKNYWLLAQHCDFDREFQKKALAIIEKHLGQSIEFKYLHDRISCGCLGTQEYNTQQICTKDSST